GVETLQRAFGIAQTEVHAGDVEVRRRRKGDQSLEYLLRFLAMSRERQRVSEKRERRGTVVGELAEHSKIVDRRLEATRQVLRAWAGAGASERERTHPGS